MLHCQPLSAARELLSPGAAPSYAGARVTLVAGPVHRATPPGVTRLNVRSAVQMQEELDRLLHDDLQGADALVMAAAVADYRPATFSETKLKKQGEGASLELVRNPDILAALGARRAGPTPVLVGFALETGDAATVESYARGKLASKRCDLIVANEASAALEGDENAVRLVSPASNVNDAPIEGTKESIAMAIVGEVAKLLKRKASS